MVFNYLKLNMKELNEMNLSTMKYKDYCMWWVMLNFR